MEVQCIVLLIIKYCIIKGVLLLLRSVANSELHGTVSVHRYMLLIRIDLLLHHFNFTEMWSGMYVYV
jgi:hypothetical protein